MGSPEICRIRNIIETSYGAVDDCCSNTPYKEIDELVSLANSSEDVRGEVFRYLCHFAENTRQSGNLLSYIIYRLTLRLEPAVKLELGREAKALDRTPSFLAAKAIEAYLRARAEKNEAIKAAIVKADKGEFISSEAMLKWMDSWGTDNEFQEPKPDVFI